MGFAGHLINRMRIHVSAGFSGDYLFNTGNQETIMLMHSTSVCVLPLMNNKPQHSPHVA